VSNDLQAGGRYRFLGNNVKQYEKRLREELNRRRVPFAPIDWNS
jgi:hypothetical protein